MCKEKIEKRQSELQQEAQKLVDERVKLGQRTNEINSRLEQIKGAFTELETQKAELLKTEPPKKEKEEKK